MKMFRATLLSATAMLLLAGSANATTFGFYKLTNNADENIASQLSVDVTAGAGGTVDFTFYNDVGIASSIADIYFDDGTLLALASITNSAGVSFDDPATPGNLPGGNTASPPFVTTQDFSADADSPVATNGVNAASEWVRINFTLQSGQTFNDTINSLNSGALRIGLHVQAIGAQGESDGYINTVPDGGMTVSLLGLALTGLGLARRRIR